MELISIGKFAKIVGVTTHTLRDMHRSGELIPCHVRPGGTRYYSTEDIGSGINYKNKGLRELISKISNREISKVVVLYKDRLMRFGYEMFEYICQLNHVEIEIIDATSQSKEQELVDDLIQIITVFANRLYGQRSNKTKQLIEEVQNHVKGKPDTIDTDA